MQGTFDLAFLVSLCMRHQAGDNHTMCLQHIAMLMATTLYPLDCMLMHTILTASHSFSETVAIELYTNGEKLRVELQ